MSFLKKCKVDDSKCAKESAQLVIPVFAAGIPELGVQRIDPITFKKLNGTTSSLKSLLTDVTVKGLKDCRAKKMQYILYLYCYIITHYFFISFTMYMSQKYSKSCILTESTGILENRFITIKNKFNNLFGVAIAYQYK